MGKDNVIPFVILVVLVLIFAAFVGTNAYSVLKAEIEEIRERITACEGVECKK